MDPISSSLGTWILLLSSLTVACVGAGEAVARELHWADSADSADSADTPGQPAQPEVSVFELGLELRVSAIRYAPESLEIDVDLDNHGPDALEIDLGGVFLAWEGLEYGPVPGAGSGGSSTLGLGAGDQARATLRYRLSRPLVGPGAHLIWRRISRPGRPQIERPSLALPPVPARSTEGGT